MHLLLIHPQLLRGKLDMHIGLYMQGWKTGPVERASQVVTCPLHQATSHFIRIRFRICQDLLLSKCQHGFLTNYLKEGITQKMIPKCEPVAPMILLPHRPAPTYRPLQLYDSEGHLKFQHGAWQFLPTTLQTLNTLRP